MNRLLTRNRKFGLSVRLRLAARRGSTEAAQALERLDEFFDFTMGHYHAVVPESVDSQTSWLDAIRDFFKWLDESGLLDLLLKLFLGALLEDAATAVDATESPSAE